MQIIKYEQVENKIVEIRRQRVILDSDVAELYGIETRVINQSVSRNLDKFPEGYIMELTDPEWVSVRSQIVISPLGGGRSYKPKAFTEKGLYMLATILKSPVATATTLAIIEAFTQVRQINRSVIEIIKNPEDESKQKSLLHKAGAMITKLVLPSEDELQVIETETTHKFNILATYEFSKKIERSKDK